MMGWPEGEMDLVEDHVLLQRFSRVDLLKAKCEYIEHEILGLNVM